MLSRLFEKLRSYLFAGIVVAAPVVLTIYLVIAIVNFFDTRVAKLLNFNFPGFGLLVTLSILVLVGFFATGLFGRFILNVGDKIIHKMPFVNSIYGALKQIVNAFFSEKAMSFREVVLVEYPRKGIWSLGFLTGVTEGEVQSLTEERVLNVFIPTTPNPTSGYLLFVPESDVKHLAMSPEDGLKMIISAGMITPVTDKD